MTRLSVGIVDVFAETPMSGNPLAVVENADALDVATMRNIAREFNQAETTFILTSTRADRRLRSFTAAGTEVFGAGHNALGAWLWLGLRGQLGALTSPQEFYQELGGDVLPITLFREDARVIGRMRQASMQLGQAVVEVAAIAVALNIGFDDVLDEPPPRAVSTGAAHLMVRVTSSHVVDRCTPDTGKLLRTLGAAGAEGCYVYAFDAGQSASAYARFFNPTVGLWEDAATGTAAGPLAAYLASTGDLAADGRLKVLQGSSMGRPSVLDIHLMPDPELSGSGLMVLEGHLVV